MYVYVCIWPKASYNLILTEPVVGFLQTLYMVGEGNLNRTVPLDIIVAPPVDLPLQITLRIVSGTAQSKNFSLHPPLYLPQLFYLSYCFYLLSLSLSLSLPHALYSVLSFSLSLSLQLVKTLNSLMTILSSPYRPVQP